jgi:hypothetical protein
VSDIETYKIDALLFKFMLGLTPQAFFQHQHSLTLILFPDVCREAMSPCKGIYDYAEEYQEGK